MELLTFSDTHGELMSNDKYITKNHIMYNIDSRFDAILIAGDIFPLDIQYDYILCINWFINEWVPDMRKLLARYGAKKIIFVAGNHDFACTKWNWNHLKETCNLEEFVYLNEELYTFTNDLNQSITIYGTPWCCMNSKFGWAFDTMNDEDALKVHFTNIPDCDVLLTHCPPYGTPLSQELHEQENKYVLKDFGNKALKDILDSKSPTKPIINTLICGHVHNGSHWEMTYNGTRMLNVSIKDNLYKTDWHASIIKFNKKYFDNK